MSFETVASATLYISASLPGSQTAGAFGALAWTKIGEITDMPSVLGREYNTVSHSPVDARQVTNKKGSYTLPNAEFMCAWDEADAGQIMLAAGSTSDAIYSFKLVKQGGAIRYFTAQVSKFVENLGTVDNVVQGGCTLLRQTDTIKA